MHNSVYRRNLLLPNQDSNVTLQISDVFVMDYVSGLSTKSQEKTPRCEGRKKERGKKSQIILPSENIVSLEWQYFTKVCCLCLHCRSQKEVFHILVFTLVLCIYILCHILRDNILILCFVLKMCAKWVYVKSKILIFYSVCVPVKASFQLN